MLLNALVLSHHLCELRCCRWLPLLFFFFLVSVFTVHIREGSLSTELLSSSCFGISDEHNSTCTAATAARWGIMGMAGVMSKVRRTNDVTLPINKGDSSFLPV